MAFYRLQLPNSNQSLWSSFKVNLIDRLQTVSYDIRFNLYDKSWYILNLVDDSTGQSILDGKRLVTNYPILTFERKSRPSIGELLLFHNEDILTPISRYNIEQFILLYMTPDDKILENLYAVYGFKYGF